jgi:hypothetical protein
MQQGHVAAVRCAAVQCVLRQARQCHHKDSMLRYAVISALAAQRFSVLCCAVLGVMLCWVAPNAPCRQLSTAQYSCNLRLTAVPCCAPCDSPHGSACSCTRCLLLSTPSVCAPKWALIVALALAGSCMPVCKPCAENTTSSTCRLPTQSQRVAFVCGGRPAGILEGV